MLLARRQWHPRASAGCLATWLVRGEWCPTTALAGAVPSSCVRGVHGRAGVGPVRFPPLFPVSYAAPALGVAVDPSGFPFSSFVGMPFHVVCVFRGLGPVALPVRVACPLCVGARLLSRRLRSSCPGPVAPPPPSSLRAHCARFPCRARVGQFHVVRTPPRFGLGFLLCLSWGGGVGFPVPVPPSLPASSRRRLGV